MGGMESTCLNISETRYSFGEQVTSSVLYYFSNCSVLYVADKNIEFKK